MSQPLSILHLFPAFDPAPGGGWSERAVRLMTAFGERALHVVASEAAVASGPVAASARFELAQAVPPLTGRPSVARYEAIARSLRGFDLVLAYGAGAIDGAMARRVFPRGTPPVIHHEDPGAGEDTGGARLYRRLALGGAAALVVSSEAGAEAARRGWRQPSARVHVIAPGIDLAAGDAAPDPAVVAAFRRSARDVVIGVVAEGLPAGALDLLVRAAAGVSGRFRLAIVGAVADAAALERTALAMGIDDRLVLTGPVDDPARFLRGFDILALPAATPGAPALVLRAMAAGVPVVAVRGSGADGLVAAANIAYIAEHTGEVRFRDLLQSLVADAALRAAVGGANRDRAVAEHDAATMIARSARLYAAVAGRSGGLD